MMINKDCNKREVMKWYDKIARLYDFFTYFFYKKARIDLINELDLKKGDRVLIIACGTGQNFNLIESKIGYKGEIIAVDYSEGMLNQAKKRVKKNKWNNIKLIQKDAREINNDFLKKENINSNFDAIIGELAFSVIPEWENVMNSSISMLKKNGKLGLLDWYRKKNDLLTKTIDYFAEAETTRNTIDYAKNLLGNIEVKDRYFFNNIYVAYVINNHR